MANMSMFKNKDKTEHSIDPDITYKLIQPAQLRVDYKNEKFSYKAYVKESMQREENKKVVSFFDLTLEWFIQKIIWYSVCSYHSDWRLGEDDANWVFTNVYTALWIMTLAYS